MKFLRAAFIFFLVTIASFAQAANSIQVSQAHWSGQDVTSTAAAYCNGKENCDYRVSRHYIGTPANESNRSFFISWKCSDEGNKIYTLQEPHDAEGRDLKVSCAGIPQRRLVAAPADKPVEKWDPLLPLQYRSSFHSRMKNRQSLGVLFGMQSAACYEAFNNHLTKRKNFYSEELIRTLTVRYEDHRLESVRNYRFYHWTKSFTSLDPIAKSSEFFRIFDYLRDSTRSLHIYVAADPESSNYAGKDLFEVNVRKNTLIYNPPRGYNFDSNIMKSFADLSSCNQEVVKLLILEGSGVSGFSYFGINNELSATTSQNSLYLQLIGEWAIDSMKYLRSREH